MCDGDVTKLLRWPTVWTLQNFQASSNPGLPGLQNLQALQFRWNGSRIRCKWTLQICCNFGKCKNEMKSERSQFIICVVWFCKTQRPLKLLKNWIQNSIVGTTSWSFDLKELWRWHFRLPEVRWKWRWHFRLPFPLPRPHPRSRPDPCISSSGGRRRSNQQQPQWHIFSNLCLHGCASMLLRFLFLFCKNRVEHFIDLQFNSMSPSLHILIGDRLSATDDGATIQFHKLPCANSLLGENVV